MPPSPPPLRRLNSEPARSTDHASTGTRPHHGPHGCDRRNRPRPSAVMSARAISARYSGSRRPGSHSGSAAASSGAGGCGRRAAEVRCAEGPGNPDRGRVRRAEGETSEPVARARRLRQGRISSGHETPRRMRDVDSQPGRAVSCLTRCHRASACGPMRPGATRSRATRPSTRRPATSTVESWPRGRTRTSGWCSSCPKSITHERRLTDVAEALRASWRRSSPSGRAPTPSGSSCRRRSARPTSARSAASCAVSRASTGTRSRCGTARSSRTRAGNSSSRAFSRAVGAEWVPFDTTVFFGSPPVSDIERDAWRNKPRVPRRTRALTYRPIVRYIGRDDPARTIAGWQYWADVVALAARGSVADRVRPHPG